MRTAIWIAIVASSACAAGEAPDSAFPTVIVDASVPAPPASAHPVKVDYMLRGYFYAYAKVSRGLGGNSTSDNMPRPIGEIKDVLTAKDGIHVLALVDEPRTFRGEYDGFRVIVANASKHQLAFNAQDSRLEIIHEAIDPSGAWTPIEYLPSSWCGNSYHTLMLPARSYWELVAPHYDGDFATRLRIRVAVGEGDDKHFTYSDEFAGRISKKQFTERQGHSASNIMDPYDD